MILILNQNLRGMNHFWGMEMKDYNIFKLKIEVDIWNKLQKISFKWKFLIWIFVVGIMFLMIYSWCGSILKVDCHQVILG